MSEGYLAGLARRVGRQAAAVPASIEREPEPRPAADAIDLTALARLLETIEDCELREEAWYTLFELRRYGDVDGVLPPELVEAVFGDLLGSGRGAAQRS